MKEKKLIFLIVGLLVILLIVWVVALHPPSKKNIKQAVKQVEENGLEFKVILETADKYLSNKENVQEFSYAEDRDIFSSQGKSISGGKIIASKLFEGLTLNGILWDSYKPLAVINGAVVGQGKTIKGVTVKKIEPNRVTLVAEGEEKILFIEGVRREINNKTEGLK